MLKIRGNSRRGNHENDENSRGEFLQGCNHGGLPVFNNGFGNTQFLRSFDFRSSNYLWHDSQLRRTSDLLPIWMQKKSDQISVQVSPRSADPFCKSRPYLGVCPGGGNEFGPGWMDLHFFLCPAILENGLDRALES